MRGLFVSLVGTAAIAPSVQLPLHGLGQRDGLSLERVRDANRDVCQDRDELSPGPGVRSAGVIEVAVVTGSSRGIGRAVAEQFASDGARVIVNSSRSVKEGEMLTRSLPEAVYAKADVSREEDATAEK